jgi:hypothetical protein
MREDLVIVRFLKAASQHGSASVVVIVISKVTSYVINQGLDDNTFKSAVKLVEEFMTLGQYVWLSGILLHEMWKISPWSKGHARKSIQTKSVGA